MLATPEVQNPTNPKSERHHLGWCFMPDHAKHVRKTREDLDHNLYAFASNLWRSVRHFYSTTTQLASPPLAFEHSLIYHSGANPLKCVVRMSFFLTRPKGSRNPQVLSSKGFANAERGEYCYEEGCARGAFQILGISEGTI